VIIYTIGHSTRSLDEFLSLLRAHGIRSLVDVRRFPGSRRCPHFGAAALPEPLGAAGIRYRHEPMLGGGRTPVAGSPNGAWRSASLRGYADHMGSQECRDALERLLAEGADLATVLMCAEAVPWRCHRQLLADALVARGSEVRHILDAGRSRPHVLHPAARVGPGKTVSYPSPVVPPGAPP